MGSLVLLTAGGLYPNQPCHALLPILQWALAWIDIENDDDDIMSHDHDDHDDQENNDGRWWLRLKPEGVARQVVQVVNFEITVA